jgi:hypothetical protein
VQTAGGARRFRVACKRKASRMARLCRGHSFSLRSG